LNAFLKSNRDSAFTGEERINGEALEELSAPIKTLKIVRKSGGIHQLRETGLNINITLRSRY
jgi:hypothetical protein